MNQQNKFAVADQNGQQNQSLAKNRQNTVTAVQARADIYEAKDGVVIYIDLPGVNKDSVALDIDQNVLTVIGRIKLDTPEKLEATYMDLRSEQFERRFTLGEELDTGRIEANMNQGVLKLIIPRLEQHKPKKIKVNVA
jgi:HSP20 family molecular chaperone IbpA